MKIFLVSMPSIHVRRRIENIRLEGYEVYWFDILNRGSFNLNPNIADIINWQTRKISYFKGEYTLSKKYPKIFFNNNNNNPLKKH